MFSLNWLIQSVSHNVCASCVGYLLVSDKEKEDNPLWKHCQIQHGGQKVRFKMICLKSFKTAFMRQINEGVRIACCEADICMNSKAEFH